MRTINLSSDSLCQMIATWLGRKVSEVEECSKDNGFMSFCYLCEHDEFSVYVPIVEFLSAFYGVPKENISLFWDDYNFKYRAEVTLEDA